MMKGKGTEIAALVCQGALKLNVWYTVGPTRRAQKIAQKRYREPRER